MSDKPFATGHCLCGNINFTIKNPPARMAQCHCKDCQRSSGTGHMSLAFFSEDDIQITGQAKGYGAIANSGNTNTRYFCPECGSRVFSRNSARPGIISIAVGSADENDWFSANAVVYCKDRAAWDVTSTDVPNFDTMPPPAPEK